MFSNRLFSTVLEMFFISALNSATEEVNFLSATCNKYNEVSFNFSTIDGGTVSFDYYENLYFIKLSNEYKECTFLKNVIIVDQ